MTLVYEKDFINFNDDTFGPTVFPSYAGSVALDVYGQTYIYKQDSVSDDTLWMLDPDTLDVIWSTTKENFRDTYIVPTFADATGGTSYWSWNLLQGGEYLIVSLSGLTSSFATQEWTALFSVNDGAAPTFIRVLKRIGWRRYRYSTAFIANGETYDDPIVFVYEFETSTDTYYDVVPSVNEFIANDVSAWWGGTSYSPATGEIPVIEGTTDTISGDQSNEYLITLTKGPSNASPQFFKVPEASATNLRLYLDKATITYQLANTGGGVNPWIKNTVGPSNAHCIITVPLGDITAANVRPTGSASTRTLTAVTPIVETTLLPSLPNEGALTLTTAAASTEISAMFGSSTVTLGGNVYIQLFVFSHDPVDGESAQPGEDLIQYVRVYNYRVDGGVLMLDDTAEGSIFNNTEYGTSNPHGGGLYFWDITQATSYLNSNNDLLIMGTTSGLGQRDNTAFLAGFGTLSSASGLRRLTQIF